MLTATVEQRILLEILKDRQPSFIVQFDIEELFRLVNRHRLLHLTSKFQMFVNIKDYSKWKSKTNAEVANSIFLKNNLLEIVSNLHKNKFLTIPLKGPCLAITLYKDIGKRQFKDIDLLIPRKDVNAITKIISKMGYTIVYPKSHLSLKQWEYYFKYKKDIGLVNRAQGVFIELHIGVYYHELLKSSEDELLWQDLSEEVIGGTPVKCMNKDNTFLYLTYHGGQHQYSRLFWLRDVAEAIKRWKLDHQKILENAKSLGIERLLGVSLELVKEFFDVEAPSDYIEYLKEDESRIQKLKRLCIKRILGPEELTVMGKLQRHYYLLLLKSGIKYKWAVINSFFHRWYIRKFLGGH